MINKFKQNLINLVWFNILDNIEYGLYCWDRVEL